MARKDIVFTKEELLALNVCPTCWDDLGYYNQYLEYVEDREKTDLHGPSDESDRKAFIEKFVQENLTGISLKNEKGRHYCPRCHSELLQEAGKVDPYE